jgi:hypothetical protein
MCEMLRFTRPPQSAMWRRPVHLDHGRDFCRLNASSGSPTGAIRLRQPKDPHPLDGRARPARLRGRPRTRGAEGASGGPKQSLVLSLAAKWPKSVGPAGVPRRSNSAEALGSEKPFGPGSWWMNRTNLKVGRDRPSLSAAALFHLEARRVPIRVVGMSIHRVAGRQFADRRHRKGISSSVRDRHICAISTEQHDSAVSSGCRVTFLTFALIGMTHSSIAIAFQTRREKRGPLTLAPEPYATSGAVRVTVDVVPRLSPWLSNLAQLPL